MSQSMGTVGATAIVSREPNRSGNFVCDGTADEVQINAAIVYAAAIGGGEVVLGHGGFVFAATVNVPAGVLLRGMGWTTILNYDAGGNCITFTGDNAKVRDLKIVIVAGAGAGGSRPNGIYASTLANLEVSDVWIVGDLTEADDGSDLRQCGIVFDTVTESRIKGNTFENNDRQSISLSLSLDNTVTENICSGNTQRGIFFSNSSNNTLTGNNCSGNTQHGIDFDTSSYNTVTGNTCSGNTQYGIYFYGSLNNAVTGNTCNENIRYGMIIYSSSDNTITGNVCNENIQDGIYFYLASDHTVTGNICSGNTRNGILINSSSNNTVTGNTCNKNDSAVSGTYDGINLYNESNDNLIMCNTCNDNDRWGISIGIEADDCVGNWVKDNQLRGNTAGSFSDAGIGTKFASVSYQFTEAVVGAVVTTSPTGVDVDADTEGALAWGQIPSEVQQVMRVKIWGVATDGPIGSPGQMHLEIIFNAGASNAAYNEAGKSWTLADFDGEETDYVADDVVHWEIVDADVGTELLALAGGDSFEIFAMHEAGAAPDGATDCLFRVVEVDYV